MASSQGHHCGKERLPHAPFMGEAVGRSFNRFCLCTWQSLQTQTVKMWWEGLALWKARILHKTRSIISCVKRALDAAAQSAGNPVAQKHSSNLSLDACHGSGIWLHPPNHLRSEKDSQTLCGISISKYKGNIQSSVLSLVPLSGTFGAVYSPAIQRIIWRDACGIAHYLGFSGLLLNISHCCNTYRYVVWDCRVWHNLCLCNFVYLAYSTSL